MDAGPKRWFRSIHQRGRVPSWRQVLNLQLDIQFRKHDIHTTGPKQVYQVSSREELAQNGGRRVSYPIHCNPTSIQPAARQRRGVRTRFRYWLLHDRPVREVASQIWGNVLNDDLTGRSAQLSYYFFLSLFPGLIFLSSVLGMILGAQSRLRDHLLDSFATFLPPAAYTLVVNTFTEILHSSTAGKAALGILFALWSATSGVSALQDTLNGVFRVRETRPFWKSTLIAVALTVVIFTLGLLAFIAFFYGGSLVDYFAAHIGLNTAVAFCWKLAQWPAALLMLSVTVAVLYHYAPDVQWQSFRWISPGSVIGVLGWLVISALFRLYLHFFDRYSVTYGSLGAVIILLLWFYLTGFMLLLGAEVNSAIRQCVMKAAPASNQPAIDAPA